MTTGVLTRQLAPGVEAQIVSSADFGSAAADLVQNQLSAKPNAVIGFPTGNTPLPLYHELLRRQKAGQIDLSRLQPVMLDDYLGAVGDNPISFFNWLRREFFDPAGIVASRIWRMPTDPDGIDQACRRYERGLMERGGVDLQLLGLGLNGHIGFNEPGSPAESRTRVIKLTETTTAANAVYWPDASKVPHSGVTMGVGTILEARSIGLLVNGAAKAGILRTALFGPMTPAVPASLLRKVHKIHVIADEAAASKLG
ncbi:MAG: glucosamine-6-phosphate deaminase [Rhizobiaceae bacterium]|nr:MAG: glucosamine-6-phosphate deaminase [Rhizobiaceae bacterium]